MTEPVQPPFALKGIDHLVLRVHDLERIKAFYCNVLGCTIERVQAEIGLTQLRAGRSLIDLVNIDGKLGRVGGAGPGASPGDGGRNVDHFCLVISPFDEAAIRAHLNRHGVKVGEVGSRYGAEGEGSSIYLDDPEGNTVELKAQLSS